ncbi:hypothetical protein Syn7502_01877 [Synechococcus sp. PCC 7502]|uniref:hypothetical protein n=1 Tax=Synechococcus sp. PCC 7502 TaxID=1173263 RepID=UPI00029FDE50|nr:hypothetical protein [Synechococcus sp. PCC 7502]AFY73911.1 hypothetical protein Syn7502_01877 [Synechococcus sp. PCC 7502]
MTRKNLSDLVRKEAQKPVDETDPTTPEDVDKTELEALTSKLKDVTAEAKHREDALESEVSRLKEELLDQKKHIVNLQAELSTFEKLKQDFAEAKAVILKLTEANQQAITPIPEEKYFYPPMPKANSESDIGSWLG